MTDKTLALLGDHEAAERLTERGELLECWRCGGGAELEELKTGGKPIYSVVCMDCSCGAYGCAHKTKEESISYPYRPVHIGREKWEPCIKCNGKCYFCKFNETSKCRKCKNHGFYSPMFNFCPDCGRPLTPEAWAELEKRLRG